MAAERESAGRATRQLAHVLAAVEASGREHPSAEQVFRRVRQLLPRVSLGTVYRNLQRLAAEGRIGVAHLGSRAARYDPEPVAHDHFVCEVCGRVEDLPSSPPAASVGVVQRAGHAVTAQSVLVRGRCRACCESQRRSAR
jgi:Fe2+ or Zn2+ uptake regulation protein